MFYFIICIPVTIGYEMEFLMVKSCDKERSNGKQEMHRKDYWLDYKKIKLGINLDSYSLCLVFPYHLLVNNSLFTVFHCDSFNDLFWKDIEFL